MKFKNFKGQESIEVIMIISVLLVITLIVVGIILRATSTGAKQIKNFNLNFISSFTYLSANSIYITLSENYNFTNFTLVVYPQNKYKYNVTSKGINNYGNIAIVATSNTLYPEYNLTAICSLEYNVGKTIYAYTKNCST